MPNRINSTQLKRLLAFAMFLSLVACGGSGSTPTSVPSDVLPALQTSARETPNTSPTPTSYAYVANYDTNDISAFKVDVATGALTWVGNTPTGTGPGSVVVNSKGTRAYVPNYDSNDISVYNIDASNGTLRQIGGAVATGTWPAALSIAPSGRFAYAANFISNSISIFRIDATSGALTNLGTVATGTNPRHLVIEPTGRFVYTANWGSRNISVFAIDATTGSLIPVGSPLSVSGTPFNLTTDRAGSHLYMTDFLNVAGGNSVSLLHIDQTTGALTADSAVTSAGAHPIAMVLDASGRFAYVANNLNGAGGNSVSAFTVDTNSGAITPIDCGCGQSGYAAGTNPSSVTASPTGTHLYVSNVTSNDITVYSIHSSSGALTRVGTTTTAGAYPMGIAFTPVPM
jgi:6-phosphogluconolactonase (cycloisomerase 2 family)